MPGEHDRTPDQSDPGAKEQVLMTLKVLGLLSSIFGALWLFESFVGP
jgi:hypothetical protein